MAGAQCDVARSSCSLLGCFGALGGGATSRWSSNATWQGPNTTWRTLFAPFWAVLDPLGRSHDALEAQRDMAGSQYDMAKL